MSSNGYQPDPYGTSGGSAGYPGGAAAYDAYAAPAYGSAPAGAQYGDAGYGQSASYGGDPYAAQSGYAAPQSYGAPGGYVQTRPTNTMALLSLIMSLVGIATGGMTSILGIIFGHLGKSQIKRTGEAGEQMALWGLIVGYVVLGLWVLFWVLYILFFVGMFGLAIWGSSAGY